MISGEKRCITCLAYKPLFEFGRNAAKPDSLQSKCRACLTEYQRWRRQQKAIAVYNYLLEHPCVDCGEPDPIVLEFDHVRGVKKADVKRMTTGAAPHLVRS